MNRRTVPLALALLATLATSCSAGLRPAGPDYDDLPGWIGKGAAFYDGDRGKAFYAVGYSDFRDPVARRQEAGVAARAELARVWRAEVDSLLKSHRKTLKKGPAEETLALFQRATEVFTTAELNLSQIIDHHFDPETGMEYALVVLDLGAYQATIEQMGALPASFRREIEASAREAFDELHRRKREAGAPPEGALP